MQDLALKNSANAILHVMFTFISCRKGSAIEGYQEKTVESTVIKALGLW